MEFKVRTRFGVKIFGDEWKEIIVTKFSKRKRVQKKFNKIYTKVIIHNRNKGYAVANSISA